VGSQFYVKTVSAVTKNLTISVPDVLSDEMKNYPEVNWSEICRNAIKNYILNRESIDPIRVQWRKELIEYVKKQRNAPLREEIVAFGCDKWFATPEEVEVILKSAIGAKKLSEWKSNKGLHYVIFTALPPGEDGKELTKNHKLAREITHRAHIRPTLE